MTDTTQPLAAGRFSHLFLLVRDHERMVSFYRDTLGMTLHEHEPGEFAFLSLPGSELRLALYPGREAAGGIENHWFIVIDVEEIARAASRLLARGVEVGEIVDVPYGRAATFADPEGNVIEIHQPNRAR